MYWRECDFRSAFFTVLLCLFSLPLAAQSYIFRSVDYPGAAGTMLWGINGSGTMVGWYQDAQLQTHSFQDNQGVFSEITYPGISYTNAVGINNNGDITGFTQSLNGIQGFLDSSGGFTSFAYPNALSTNGFGINDSAEIVGNYLSAGSNGNQVHGFLLRNGAFSTIDYPGAWQTSARGIDDNGTIVGIYAPLPGPGTQSGFLYDGNSFLSLSFPGVGETQYTLAYGVNDSGEVVGYYWDTTGIHGFIYLDGQYTSLDYPGAEWTVAFGVNDSGQIVGLYSDPQNNLHGFIATPVPEPDTILLLGSGLLLLVGALRRKLF